MSGFRLFLDTEGTGLGMLDKDHVTQLSYALDDQPVQYADYRDGENWQRGFREALDKADILVAHGMKFDAHALRTIDININDRNLDCTIVRAQLLDEHRLTYDLDALTGMKVDIISELAKKFGGAATKNVQMPNLHRAPREFVKKYAIGDIEALRTLYYDQEKQEMPPVHALEKEVLKVLIKMEQKGIRVDMGRAEKAIDDVKKLIDKAQRDLDKLAGLSVNVNSSPQMRALLVATELKDGRTVPKRTGKSRIIQVTKKGVTEDIEVGMKYVLIDGTLAECSAKTGGASLNADILEEMTHPLSDAILKVRKYRKILDTFLISQLMGHHINGRVHPWFNQTRVVTGRLSCSSPNMQAVPKRDPEMKAILRPLFLPEQGRRLLKCDYDQSDVRGFAHYIATTTGDKNHPVLKAYQADPDTDFHTFVSELLGIPRDPHPGGGGNAKQINLAMIFNMGNGKLAKQMGLPYYEEIGKNGKIYLKPGSEAEEVFNLYHSKIPGAADMGKKASAVAASRGYVVSIGGRYLRFPKKGFSYKASGYLYQAFTADLIKAAMVETAKILIPHLQIHDELIFSIDHDDQAWAIRDAMQTSILNWLNTNIPIRTWPEVGPNWGETKKLESPGRDKS